MLPMVKYSFIENNCDGIQAGFQTQLVIFTSLKELTAYHKKVNLKTNQCYIKQALSVQDK